MTTTRIQQIAIAAGFAAVVHEGEVIVSGLGEGPLAVVSPIPGSRNGLRVVVPARLELGLRDRIVRAFSRRSKGPPREVSVVLAGAPAPEVGPVRVAPAALLNTAPSPRRRAVGSPWTAPLEGLPPARVGRTKRRQKRDRRM